MRWGIPVLVLLCLCASAADKKPPDVKILEFSPRWESVSVVIDGNLRVAAEKPINDLVLAFEFLDGARSSIVTKQVKVDEPRLVPGDESSFHFAASAPSKAAQIRIRAYRNTSLEISVENGGPHTIE